MRRWTVLIATALIAAACTGQVAAPRLGRSPSVGPGPERTQQPRPKPSSSPLPVGPLHGFPTFGLAWGQGDHNAAFWDTRHGLIAEHGRLWFSGDGFHTWSVRYEAPGPIRGISTLGTNRVWITAGCPHAGCSGTLFRSDDRGRHWTKVGPTTERDIQFVTPTLAYAVHPRERTLSRSTDGGQTWGRFARPCVVGGVDTLSDVEFSTPKVGLAVCTLMYGAGSQAKAVIRTEDGGRTWRFVAGSYLTKNRNVEAAGGLSGGGYAWSVSMLPDGHAWLPEMWQGLIATSDGGRHWEHVSSPVTDASGAKVFPDGSGLLYGLEAKGWALYRTTDFGGTWDLVHLFRP